MALGFWEALIALPILLLATAFGLSRLPRLLRQWKRTDQRQSSPESQYTSPTPVSDYEPHGWPHGYGWPHGWPDAELMETIQVGKKTKSAINNERQNRC